MNSIKISDLEKKAKEFRREVLDLSLDTGEGHLGGSYSIIELMISLYDAVLEKDDKFILSKGHACYPLYLLLREQGYNPTIAGHPDIDSRNGIYCTTGSLGHGLPIGTGMALAKKFKKEKGEIYVLMGDGECQEGTTWESSLIAAQYNLDNLVGIVDYNKLQAIAELDHVLSLGNLRNKFEAFGWEVSEIDGHDFGEIIPQLKERTLEKPSMILAHTIKGKGVGFMEGKPEWHMRMPNQEELDQMRHELK